MSVIKSVRIYQAIIIAFFVGVSISSIFADAVSNIEDRSSCGLLDFVNPDDNLPVTVGQYCEFLNAIASIDTYGVYDERMGGDESTAGLIVRSKSLNGMSYSIASGHEDSPIIYVSPTNAERYYNWCYNGRPHGKQEEGTTETGVYMLIDNLKPTPYSNISAMSWPNPRPTPTPGPSEPVPGEPYGGFGGYSNISAMSWPNPRPTPTPGPSEPVPGEPYGSFGG